MVKSSPSYSDFFGDAKSWVDTVINFNECSVVPQCGHQRQQYPHCLRDCIKNVCVYVGRKVLNSGRLQPHNTLAVWCISPSIIWIGLNSCSSMTSIRIFVANIKTFCRYCNAAGISNLCTHVRRVPQIKSTDTQIFTYFENGYCTRFDSDYPTRFSADAS